MAAENTLELFVSNFATGKTRRVKMDGREYIVAPVTMMVPGVLHGSKGPLLYPSSEVNRNHTDWNGMPIVVNHPLAKDGKPVSARSPAVLQKYGIGVVYESAFSNKLGAEGWFDVEKTRRVDARVLNALEAGLPIELSTGLFTDNEPAEGFHNGREYKFIARNYRPDHLAILPDTTGACSVRDGCGVLVNEEINTNDCGCQDCKAKRKKAKMIAGEQVEDEENQVSNERATMATKSEMIETLVANCECQTKAAKVRKGLEVLNEDALEVLVANAAAKPNGEEEETEDEAEKPTGNATAANQTVEQWMQTAPADVRRMVNNYRKAETQQKELLVNQIMADERNPFAKEFLMAKEVGELQGIAAFTANNSRQQQEPQMFHGAAGGPAINQSQFESEDHDMAPPVLNWADARKSA